MAEGNFLEKMKKADDLKFELEWIFTIFFAYADGPLRETSIRIKIDIIKQHNAIHGSSIIWLSVKIEVLQISFETFLVQLVSLPLPIYNCDNRRM